MTDQTYYANGFDESISQTHSWRTAENCAEYMLKYVKHNYKILDVGSGPGTITKSFAKYIPDGYIIGIEPTAELIEEASKDPNLPYNVRFEKASVFNLPYSDNSFDIVHAHQVIVHLSDPLKALNEMTRVLKPGGLLCIKDAEMDSTTVFPKKFEPQLLYFMNLMRSKFTSSVGASRQKSLILQTSLLDIVRHTASSWCISEDKERLLFANMFIKRLEASKVNYISFTREKITQAWIDWSQDESAVFFILNGEIIAKKI
ncbi:hypothetical protein WICMUC_002685 [Wickerhamomyces mucosus]|uniref:Methyltransferase domain-containing protein n=1 Tax=Wickerhamomyces mucosus TaxID=1378264 RepID=A0A9P8PQI3_9ASCO|nr:hypothetical protein WICMUC_002685 [Wickerhamomyces mucosus]